MRQVSVFDNVVLFISNNADGEGDERNGADPSGWAPSSSAAFGHVRLRFYSKKSLKIRHKQDKPGGAPTTRPKPIDITMSNASTASVDRKVTKFNILHQTAS